MKSEKETNDNEKKITSESHVSFHTSQKDKTIQKH